ncbi:MAG TPA: N-acetylmuramoyl-L-alanine amidase-like domain-containing protein [Candidatus Eisenbacteria bacterium]|nr:N-acetylmuramoyl-L-alanine amidase-like domain-containing protein [Candidatus Eisenbacteria bacterium]
MSVVIAAALLSSLALPFPAAAASLPPRLAGALELHDPLALADTTLPRLAALDSAQRASLGRALADWPVDWRVAAFAFLQVGTPYQLGPLGEGQPPDADPVLTFETTDCAVLNLVSAALAHALESGGEHRAMARAGYRGGRITYADRFHFTTDRLDASPYYRDITRRVAGASCLSRQVVLNRRADGGRWIDIAWSRPRTVRFVPRDSSARFARWHAEGRLPDATGVAFVKRETLADGLDVVHESLLWKGRTLLHASSTTGRVVTIPWADYLAGPGRGFDGFVLFEYR